jgi:hypothetical protein
MQTEQNTLSKEYEAALAAHDAAQVIFQAAIFSYRALKIGDAEFLAARALYAEATAAFDLAFNEEQIRQTATRKPPPNTTAAIRLLTSIAETIRHLKQVPSSRLYAAVIDELSLEQYEQVIGVLKGAGLIRIENHLISWVG